ncbi:MAG TPA: LysR family transcriptional regulator [Steroidobacteraceae bacterium]|nr:LysR family transcriptional regulator [Steroidobacteraceae bacterium]
MAKTPRLLDLLSLVPAGDLARGAMALGIAPDALKKRVEQFESALGFKLMDRATKALKPGEAGRLVIDHANRIFSQARDLTRDLEELAGLQAPALLFGVDMLAAELPLGAALGRMASANTRLRVQALLGNFEFLAKEVLGGRLEFAIADTTSAERHPTRLAIEPIAEHRVFFFVRRGHPLLAAKALTLESILEFPLVAPRLPQRIAVHVAKAKPQSKIDRDTGDLNPELMLDTFSTVRNVVLAGDAVGLAPYSALDADLRAGRLRILAFNAPWLHMSYGLFYPRRQAISRVGQLFVTQLRQVESAIQAREQRALVRLEARGRRARPRAKTRSRPARGAAARPATRPRRP